MLYFKRNHAECIEILTTFYPNRGGMAAGPSVPPSRRNSLASIVSDAGVTDSVPVPLKVPENPKFSMSSSSPPDLKQTAPTAPTDSNFEQKEGKEPKKSSVFVRGVKNRLYHRSIFLAETTFSTDMRQAISSRSSNAIIL